MLRYSGKLGKNAERVTGGKQLFEEDKKALGSLPEKPFRIERFERVKTDGYGKFCLDGKHWYSSAPELGQREIVVGIGAHAVTVYRTVR